ncbi:basic leucine zipper 34-like [Vigna unguiculata]|uniref:basic leucine zipper 34-like n=1 Tax=Vigna unguiculata TaxID=3917 RepID=UPI0010164998|nr:basic leucine zipper 34-like [Vigna unguiculata]XP_027941823.1 basic leucine zipper 34-like [Vigna unguiculata]XP_027941824.1 basic leucine zipper 34-like [Vigna unguiculata]XP_027941825.1 basic leucine zipper 34-like [Vigna unguiculata]XP_027941826.1 basic leucine zipper 34-like [Vigna unguiculata]XP_027941827.1 basic leucine zipper 34-like [Vigna unguiculata]
MEEVKITGNLIEEKIWSKIPILVKPVPLRPQPWRKPSKPLQKLPTIPENDQILTEGNLNGDHNNFNELQPNIEQEMRNKFKRIVSNRYAARRSRLKKLAYVEELENELKSCERKREVLHGEIAEQRKKHLSLEIENHTLKFHLAAREKQRILQEVEIEKNRAEVGRMMEVQRRMVNLRSLQLMTNSNFNPSAFI